MSGYNLEKFCAKVWTMVRDEGGGKTGRGLHTTPSLHFIPICAPICAPFASKKPLGSPIFG